MRHYGWFLLLLLVAGTALGAQSVDLAAGGGAAFGGNTGHGFWPVVSGTGWFGPHIGLNGSFGFRANQGNLNFGQKFFDAGLALRPAPSRWTPELLLGYAWLDTGPADQACLANLPIPCTLPQLNRNAFHLGAALKTYLNRAVFLQVGYHLYVGHNLDFGAGGPVNHVSRFAVMLGYTFGKR